MDCGAHIGLIIRFDEDNVRAIRVPTARLIDVASVSVTMKLPSFEDLAA